MEKAQVCFLLSRNEKALFDSLANYYEITKTELLRRWIFAEGRDILQPAVDEAIRLGIAENDNRTPNITVIRKREVQQHMENAGVSKIAGTMAAVVS